MLRSGTGAGVRARYNLNFPAAGKTGTSHDGWFAGYTSELLCVVWVGFDDNRELDLEGAHSAAPIWAQFMKQALQYPQYRDVKAFQAPEGVVSIEIDPESGMPATPGCPTHRTEVYIAGTQPVGFCPLHGGRSVTNVAGWEVVSAPAATSEQGRPATGEATAGEGQVAPSAVARRVARQEATPAPAKAAGAPVDAKKPEKKGFFRRLIGVFK